MATTTEFADERTKLAVLRTLALYLAPTLTIATTISGLGLLGFMLAFLHQ